MSRNVRKEKGKSKREINENDEKEKEGKCDKKRMPM